MTTLRDLRRELHSVENIQKITQAMEVVAASRLRKAQAKMEAARPFTEKSKEMLERLIASSPDVQHHPLLDARPVKRIGLVIIAGDRGLCGGYNHNIFNAAERFLHEATCDVALIPVGRRTVDYFATKKWTTLFKIEEWGGKITYPEIKEFTLSLMNAYLEGQVDEIWVVHTHFINMTTRQIRTEKLLNIESKPSLSLKDQYLFEPDLATILAHLLPLYCTISMQAFLNDAYTAELAARIFSMQAATKNAKDMKEKLILKRNKVRQSGITKELIEITSGAESLREG